MSEVKIDPDVPLNLKKISTGVDIQNMCINSPLHMLHTNIKIEIEPWDDTESQERYAPEAKLVSNSLKDNMYINNITNTSKNLWLDTPESTHFKNKIFIKAEPINEECDNREKKVDLSKVKSELPNLNVFKMPKTNAEICKEYRKRKKEANKIIQVPEITVKKRNNAKNCQMYRLRKKMFTQGYQSSTNQVIDTPSTQNSPMTFESSSLNSTTDQLNRLSQHMNEETDMAPVEYCVITIEKSETKTLENNPVKEKVPLEKPFSCDICGRKYSQNKILKRHKNTHNNIKPHICTTCGKGFTQLSILLQHNRIHTGEKPYTCDICKKSFSRKDSLNDHKKIHNFLRPHVCGVCDKNFKSSRGLRQHKATHTGRALTCDDCGKIFKDKGSLIVHKTVHDTIKPFPCDLCEKSFKRLNILQEHKLTHTGEKPFTCNTCGKAFSQKGSYNRHKNIHENTKSYVCNLCGKGFKSSSNLKQHTAIHNGEKPFSCDVCKKSFRHKRNLHEHISAHCMMVS